MIANKALGLAAFALLLPLTTLGCGAASHDEELGTSEAELKKDGGPRLAHYEDTYWRWTLGDKTLPTDAYGNAVEKNVAMMPIPQVAGDGTGSADVTLGSGESFMLPLFAALGTSYRNGTPPDPFEPKSIYETLEISFKVDGKELISSCNVMSYFSKFSFNPEIPIDDAVIKAVIWFEGVGVLHAPLPPGNHVLTLDAMNTEPQFGEIIEYHNTWNVTVRPGH